jgi:hypothetical protein
MPGNWDWVATGLPVLWDSCILSLPELLPEAGDFAHVYNFKDGPDHAMDVEAYRRLAAVYESVLHASAEEASAALIAAAPNYGRARGYLHNCIGISDDAVVLIVAHGRLERLGELAKAAGCTHALIIDNGGSPQISVRRPGGELRPIIESHYWRPPSIAVAAFQIATDTGSERMPMIGEEA